MSEVTTLLPQADFGHRVPSDWNLKEMRSLGEVKTGLTYKPEDVAKHGTLVLRSSNIQAERLVFEDNVFVSKKVGDGATVRKGDILICVRNGSRRLIGKSALITAEADGMAFGAFMSAFRSDLSPYLIWVFQSEIVQRQIEENLGATINQITNATLKALKVPMPPPHEQQAIAAALSDADGVVAGLERLIGKKRLVKQGAMQDLLTARRRLPGFSGEWEDVAFGAIGPFVGGGTPSMARPEYWKDGTIAWVSSSDVRIGILSGADRLISDAAVKGSSTRVVDPGAILFVTRSGILRRFQPVMMNSVPVAINQDIKALLPRKSNYLPIYVFHAAVASGDQIIRDCMKTGTTVESIDLGALRRFTIKCPNDLHEQQAIAAVLSDMDSEIQTLESRLAKARAVKEGMMQNLLTGRVRLV
jgi:type I restriction enzyme S subunit